MGVQQCLEVYYRQVHALIIMIQTEFYINEKGNRNRLKTDSGLD